jgi:hypothetical protein
MAKGKKASGKHYTSKGERRSSISTKNRDPGIRLLNQMAALAKGKDVVFTIENPNKNETNKRFIKQRVSGKEFLKNRAGGYIMKSAMGGEG